MNKEVLFLEQFRDLKISKKYLYSQISKNTLLETIVIVNANNVIHLLEMFMRNKISKDALIDWVNVIWFSDWYDYEEEQSDSIAIVMSELEELDETENELKEEQLLEWISALKQNVEF